MFLGDLNARCYRLWISRCSYQPDSRRRSELGNCCGWLSLGKVPNAPSIRIASIGGSSVPATPTGNADVTLPANITNPVTVNFETANVPTGNTIKLRVAPAYGDSVEVLSPAITGTTAAGATSVSVTLPQGPSVLQAITSFTVTVAQADALQHFAQNERVEKVELIASVGGATRAELVTASGKRIAVPLTVLQMAGVTG